MVGTLGAMTDTESMNRGLRSWTTALRRLRPGERTIGHVERRGARPPRLFVDAQYTTWQRVGPGDRYRVVSGCPGARFRALRRPHRLVAARSPIRPVVSMSPADLHRLDQITAEAGAHAVPTLGAATLEVLTMLRDSHLHLGLAKASRLARVRLSAGCDDPGLLAEWEALLQPPAHQPAGGISRPHLHAVSRLIIGWMCAPDEFTSPAESLVRAARLHAGT
jgi:hypothetical protein